MWKTVIVALLAVVILITLLGVMPEVQAFPIVLGVVVRTIVRVVVLA
jgi:hypothetical protein